MLTRTLRTWMALLACSAMTAAGAGCSSRRAEPAAPGLTGAPDEGAGGQEAPPIGLDTATIPETAGMIKGTDSTAIGEISDLFLLDYDADAVDTYLDKGDATLLAQTVDDMRQTWAGVRSAVEARFGIVTAARIDADVRRMQAAHTAAADRAAADSLIDFVGGLENQVIGSGPSPGHATPRLKDTTRK